MSEDDMSEDDQEGTGALISELSEFLLKVESAFEMKAERLNEMEPDSAWCAEPGKLNVGVLSFDIEQFEIWKEVQWEEVFSSVLFWKSGSPDLAGLLRVRAVLDEVLANNGHQSTNQPTDNQTNKLN